MEGVQGRGNSPALGARKQGEGRRHREKGRGRRRERGEWERERETNKHPLQGHVSNYPTSAH